MREINVQWSDTPCPSTPFVVDLHFWSLDEDCCLSPLHTYGVSGWEYRVVSISAAFIVCESDEVYAKVIKKSGSTVSGESFDILSGSQTVFSSQPFVPDQQKTMELCLSDSGNKQFTIVLKFAENGLWSDGSWVAIYGANGNVALKAFMSVKAEERIRFSLYSPVNKGDSWKHSDTFASDWKSYAFQDSAWSATSGSAISVSGTHYFRKSFTGLANMVAIDARFLYKFGIVAYINGIEIYRDNMPAGEVTAATLATGSYPSADYRGILRALVAGSESQAVLAVEIHLTSATQQSLQFDAFLAYYPGLSETNKCFNVPEVASAISPVFTGATKAFDYSNVESATVSRTMLPADLFIDFGRAPLPMFNALRMWPAYSWGNLPSSFDLSGGSSVSGSSWTSLFSPTNVVYSSEWKYWISLLDPVSYPALKLTVSSGQTSRVMIPELQFLICSISDAAAIVYPESSYSYYAKYNTVDLSVSVFGMTNCRTTPTLPNGVTINPTTCAITGVATEGRAQTVYTINAEAGTRTVSGTLTLTFMDCAGSMLRIRRAYQGRASSEAFHIRNTANDEMLLDVPIGHSHPSSSDTIIYYCMTAERFDVTLESDYNTWEKNSYLYVYMILPENEEELMLKARYDSLQSNDITYYLRLPSVASAGQWYYKMGQVPQNWFSEEVSGWQQGSRGSFGESSNQIQLYKRIFTINSLSEVSGFILSIRYKYGCVVYMNGHEAWRNHVAGSLSDSSVANNAYSDVLYRVVSLPGRSITLQEGDASVEYLRQGSNVIAIAVIAQNAEQKTSFFDATVRLMTNEPESHIWDFTATATGTTDEPENAFDGYYYTDVRSSTCSSNSITVTLNNDRYEWISSLEIQNYYGSNTRTVRSFKLYGRGSASDSWTLLKSVSGLTFSMAAQRRRIYFPNNKPYNQFKFENFSTDDETSCAWTVQSLNLYAENVMVNQVPLSYPTNTIIFQNIEMAEVIPTGTGYSDFAVTPALPPGIVLDAQNGWISGTATELMTPTTYQVSATSILGTRSTVSFTLSVEICSNGRNLITVRIRADGNDKENFWKLFAGRTTQGTPLRSVDRFPVRSTYYYLDFCLEHGLFTFVGGDSYGDGWKAEAGYTLTVDQGALELEVMTLSRMGTAPITGTTTFSTFFPFQVEFTDWKVYQGESVAAGWNGVDFDDAAWETKKAAEIANPSVVTTYIRKSFQLTNVDDYQVLNVRMKYAGGVAVYFNGNRVARFNLIDEFDANTESIEVHDATVFSKFHIILVTAGVQEGTNVIAFEVHRPVGTSSSEAFVFDATGVFGVETCSAVVDTFSQLTSSSLSSGTLEGIMDLDPYTMGLLPNSIGVFIEWAVENLEGSKWNSFNLIPAEDVRSISYILFGIRNMQDDQEERTTMLRTYDVTINSRTKPQAAVPVALSSFRWYRWEVLIPPIYSTSFISMHFAYCKASGAVCPGVDSYPPVAEGQISPSSCPAGYRGYAYRECSSGQLGEVKMDQCSYKRPADVRYRSSRFTFVIDLAVTTGLPTYTNIATRFFMDEGVQLPQGLVFNEQTGEISGVPTEPVNATAYTIYASNPSGAASTSVTISVRKGQCKAEDVFPVTEVGTVATYKCSTHGSNLGTKTRECVLGATDGEWKRESGMCISVLTVVILVFIAIVVIVVVVLVLSRFKGRKKATAGSKGMPAKKTLKKGDKKPKQSVKV